MKFIPSPEISHLESSLNFDTADTQVRGGCELYTTKFAGRDKKLSRIISAKLESQHDHQSKQTASLIRSQLTANGMVSSPAEHNGRRDLVNELQTSAFGPLNSPSAKRMLFYLIATLNTSHSDYDFSNALRPYEFTNEPDFTAVSKIIDNALGNVRPKQTAVLECEGEDMAIVSGYEYGIIQPPNAPVWGPAMWREIDREMDLTRCKVFRWDPQDDPFDEEMNDRFCLWSMHYLFYNKPRRRVCYLYVRGLSAFINGPQQWYRERRLSQRQMSLCDQEEVGKPGDGHTTGHYAHDFDDDEDDLVVGTDEELVGINADFDSDDEDDGSDRGGDGEHNSDEHEHSDDKGDGGQNDDNNEDDKVIPDERGTCKRTLAC